VFTAGVTQLERISLPKPPLGMPDAQADVWRQKA
jgi:hypothetical protein